MNTLKKLTYVLFILFTSTMLSATKLILELVDAKNVALPGEKNAQITVFTGETFRLKTIIKNADRNTGEAKINGIEKLNVLGKSSHSNFTMLINGNLTAENSRVYDVCAENEGTYEIGPAEVQQNGSNIKSDTIKFRVIKRPENYHENDESEKDNENIIKCQLLADKKNVFVGEPLIVTLKIKCLGQIHNLELGEQLNFPGFQTKDDQKPEHKVESEDSKNYQVIEKKFNLIALEPGEQKINPAKINYHVPQRKKTHPMGMLDDGFFGFGGFFDHMQLVQKSAYSNSLKIKIMPLPQNQEPYDGVGKFTIYNSSVDKNKALLNEAIKLTLEIEGEGNFEQISTPKLTLDACIKCYESKSEFIEDSSARPFAGKKLFEYVIQVNKVGQVVIPEQKFTYLDTETKSTKTLETKSITLQITQPEGEVEQYVNAPSIQSKDIEGNVSEQAHQNATQEYESEISFIEQDGQIVQKNSWIMPWWLMLLLLIFPIILYAQASKSIFSKFFSNKLFIKISKKSSLKKIVHDFQKIRISNNPEHLYSLFLNLLALKFDMPPHSISHDQIIEKLKQNGIEEAKISDFIDFLNECASLHFITAQSTYEIINVESLFKKGEYWIIVLTK